MNSLTSTAEGTAHFVVISYFYADNYQQYLARNPFGYRCHANTGVRFPAA